MGANVIIQRNAISATLPQLCPRSPVGGLSDWGMRVLRLLPEKVGQYVVVSIDGQRCIWIAGHAIPCCQPRISWTARPATMWVEAFVPGPVMIRGITEASATRKPKIPCTKLWVDNSEFVHPHFARTNCVFQTRRGSLASSRISSALALGPENEFALTQAIKGMLVPEFTRDFDRSHDGCKIVIRAEVVAIDHSGILKIAAGQADGTNAGGLSRQCFMSLVASPQLQRSKPLAMAH